MSEWHDAEAGHKRESGLLTVAPLNHTIRLPDHCTARVTRAGSSLTAMYYYTSALRWPLEWIPRGDVWIHAACSYAISPSTETWPPSPPPADATSATSRAQSMDQHGAIILQPLRPNTIGLIPGGRTTYFDIHGVCNAFQPAMPLPEPLSSAPTGTKLTSPVPTSPPSLAHGPSPAAPDPLATSASTLTAPHLNLTLWVQGLAFRTVPRRGRGGTWPRHDSVQPCPHN